jgi:hypothetical protein
MGLDAGQVLKRLVLCRHCHEERLFTLRAIVDSRPLECSGCGSTIRISDRVYEPLMKEVRNTLSTIDFIQSNPLSYHSTGLHRFGVTRLQ